jgi:hypothetical protein
MTDRVFTLITLATSGTFGLLVPLVVELLSRGRERASFWRSNYQATNERLRSLYLDVLEDIKRGRALWKRKDDGSNPNFLFLAKLMLESTPEIMEQFDTVATMLNRWIDIRISLDPQPIAGTTLAIQTFHPGNEKLEEEAKKLADMVDAEIGKLTGMMRAHLKQEEKRYRIAQ